VARHEGLETRTTADSEVCATWVAASQVSVIRGFSKEKQKSLEIALRHQLRSVLGSQVGIMRDRAWASIVKAAGKC